MSRSDDKRLEDIAEAGVQIASIVANGRDALVGDRLIQLALERLLEIIGEAMSKMSSHFRESHPEVDWPAVIGMRNLLAHAYHRIEVDLVWRAAAEGTPTLLEAIGLSPTL